MNHGPRVSGVGATCWEMDNGPRVSVGYSETLAWVTCGVRYGTCRVGVSVEELVGDVVGLLVG